MKERKRKKQVLKHAVKCTTVAAVAFTMALQPCFAFTAQAYVGSYESSSPDYPYWDDPNYSSSYYWDAAEDRKVSNVTRTYDDGTKYSAEYKYNAAGALVYSNIKDEEGNRSTVNKSYNGDILVSESIYAYDASRKTEETQTIEYREDGYRSHSLEKIKREDGRTESLERWYLNENNPLKYLSISLDGSTIQADYTYNEYGKPLTRTTASSSGDIDYEEWHYNEAGETIGIMEYEYLAASQRKDTTERYYDAGGNAGNLYIIRTVEIEGVLQSKIESWYIDNGYTPIKEVITYSDGTQSTEDYVYDADGDETRYTSVSRFGATSTRETTYTRDGKTTVESDSSGNKTVNSSSYDARTEQYTSEVTVTKADGSSRYEKTVSVNRYGYDSSYYISRQTTAEGVETYTETTTESDGSSTRKDKNKDGSVTVTKTDSAGNQISIERTLSDGTKTETTETRREDGKLTSEVTKYSDGSEDRTDYEYAESGDLVKKTESRRNGVSSVTVYQYNETNKNLSTRTETFNNGLQFIQSFEELDEYRDHIVITYSGGEVVQDIYTDTTNDSAYIKTIYRDGRMEEVTLNVTIDGERELLYEKIAVINDRMESFDEQAWGMLPAQPAA